jgi:hypothetical protein
MQKYLPHIRIPFKLFDDERIRRIPKKHRASSLLILIALLKFVNSQSGQCYPRRSTISSMVGLSRSTVYRCTDLLQKVGVLTKKRLKSTVLYTVRSEYLVNKKHDVSPRSLSSVMVIPISRTTINLTNIDKNIIIDKLSTFPRHTLIKAIQEKDNPYYCKQALTILDNKGNGVLVDLPKGIELEKLRKKTNFAYQRAVYKNKRNNDRKIKSKDLLRSDSKD